MTSKSPKGVAATVYEAGKKALPKCANQFSRKDCTCAQRFAILVEIDDQWSTTTKRYTTWQDNMAR